MSSTQIWILKEQITWGSHGGKEIQTFSSTSSLSGDAHKSSEVWMLKKETSFSSKIEQTGSDKQFYEMLK